MDEKASFILEWELGEAHVHGTVQVLRGLAHLGLPPVVRYLLRGVAGLREHSRAPRRVWNRTAPELEQAIVGLRRKRKRIGPLKIHQLLSERYRGRRKLPSVSTIDLVLKRHGLMKKRRRVRRIREVHPIFEAEGPNEIWSVDFKGEFRMGDGRYCYPLTVMDAYSRYVLAVVGMHRPTYEGTKAVFEALFRKYGLPKQIHSDNGEPFASAVSLSRLTRLAVWFMDLGILPVYSDPGHPEHNGSHERMHEELKAEATKPSAYNLARSSGSLTPFATSTTSSVRIRRWGSVDPRSSTAAQRDACHTRRGRGSTRRASAPSTCVATGLFAGAPASGSWSARP